MVKGVVWFGDLVVTMLVEWWCGFMVVVNYE